MTPPHPDLLRRIQAPHPDTAPLPPAARLADGVRLLRGVPYHVPEGGRPLECDLWLPADGTTDAPLVLFLHGGAWRRGRRDDMGMRTRDWDPAPFARIAAAGCAVASADYRLSGEARFPAPLQDAQAALRWLTVRSGELGTDPHRTVAWGESAGGHLAALLALTRPRPALAGAVVWYGPSDLATPRGGFDPGNPDTPEALLLGAAPATVPEQARAASPLAQAHGAAPPFLLCHGAGDTMVPPSHSEDLAAALRAAGAPAELRLVPDADHGWYGAPEAAVASVFAASLDFVLSRSRAAGDNGTR
ncbi:alpha/beta hydrolase [Streptomyces albus]|uniref:alpha/beta hydrolase n=1 Tax=Streptomyces albus TaxID=1888 RepID=UPI0024ACB082|nr:alpha/beta hydrolase [Streptomyces albus]MDI6413339.1 alpha/beta hydrolase [Streptomyces albus]